MSFKFNPITTELDLVNAVPAFPTTREVLSSNRAYYVRKDGNDANTGLVNSPDGAFLTIQKALTVTAMLDMNAMMVTIQVNAGTYSEAVVVPVMVGQSSVSSLIISGDFGTPGNVIISATGVFDACFRANFGAAATIYGFTLTSSNGFGLYGGGGYMQYQQLNFGTCAQPQVWCEAGLTESYGSNFVSGNSGSHFAASGSGVIKFQFGSLTASSPVTYSTAFATASSGGVLVSSGVTFSGTVNGNRYLADVNGVIQTYGSGSTYFPGTIAGSTSTGGVYN